MLRIFLKQDDHKATIQIVKSMLRIFLKQDDPKVTIQIVKFI